MIRIYSLQYTLFKYFFIYQFFSYFCYVNTTFFAILRSFYALWKCFYQKCATFGLFHISRLRSVLTTYVFSRFLSYYFRKGRNIQITYYVCLLCNVSTYMNGIKVNIYLTLHALKLLVPPHQRKQLTYKYIGL